MCLLMDLRIGDILEMKKKHPCGGYKMLILRAGMDFRIRCITCSHEVMLSRSNLERSIKKIIREDDDNV